MSFINGGMILVLFILLVIVTTFIYSSTQRDNQLDEDLTMIQVSKGFNIYNRTTNFTLVSISLTGEFDRPFPPAHIILPYRSYHFEVRTTPHKNYSAYVTYNVVSGDETVGNIRINMRTEDAAPTTPTTIVDFINGPIRYEKGGTYVNIFDL
ncbi:hypothetical protein [Paenibacillus herberti]|uniref:Uncharacterized protein n=1 Tax=Paenibacillus herberti TaxID=1619309 RepID=A0A229P322_9BACL|nr:hypothetical protein [Paenibacillus herberti]OXM16487.1 hypothetical protein CGZ75_07385 [Paenibacillus herberti]